MIVSATLAAAIAFVAAVVVLRRRYVVVHVNGSSMQPVLREGQRVLVRRAGVGAVRRGDLVVFALEAVRSRQPHDPPWMVKRAIALAGDPVPDGSVPRSADAHGVVPEGKLIVRGEDSVSYDSRKAGPVDGAALLGVVVRVLA